MLTANNYGIYESSLLTSIAIRHGYSAKSHGDTRDQAVLDSILGRGGWSFGQYVGAEQVHGNGIAHVDHVQPEVRAVDGLVTGKSGLVLGVKTADCVPLLLADPDARIVAAVHAGWRGTIAEIAMKAVAAMVAKGANPAAIRVSIGPHIGACCYSVSSDRAARFIEYFGDQSGIVTKEGDGWYLDLGKANAHLLTKMGVHPDYIEINELCTSCQSDTFYSYRKHKDNGFGEMVSFISV
ncbi:peptidoglycan editing factor PgeF [Patescibacteria group bacterium]|nr:peptidoglycan editing factor PgeF [Patescibacteria group bacterium]